MLKKNEYEEKIAELKKKEGELLEVLQSANHEEMQALEGLKQVLTGETPEFLEQSFESTSEGRSPEGRGFGSKESFKYL